MASSFIEQAANIETRKHHGYAIAPGVVTDNLNLLLEGKVQVRIPTIPSMEPWARLAAPGAGSSRGLLWVPQIDDEVLVAFNENDERDAYIIGGLWNTTDRPPATLPNEFLSKRIIKTGLAGGLGHKVEFDDALQSIKITSSTNQEISIDPKKISISAAMGAMTITLDLAATPPAITLQALGGDINLKAPAGKISLQALDVDIQGAVSASLGSEGECAVQGLVVRIN